MMKVHPSLFAQTEEFRKILERNGIRPTMTKATNLMSKYVQVPKKLNLLGEPNGKKQKRKCS